MIVGYWVIQSSIKIQAVKRLIELPQPFGEKQMSNEMALMREIAKLQEQINALRTIEIGGVWQDWTLSATGWAAGYTGFVRYSAVGKICHMIIDINGTSNFTYATLDSLPFNVSASGGNLYFQIPNVTNNDTQIITGGRSFAQVRPVGQTFPNTVWFWLDGAAEGWTASGTKRVRVALFYEIA